ncbi:MAG: hypothetical protein ACOC36_02885, partial [Fibrobacterota bacterium]
NSYSKALEERDVTAQGKPFSAQPWVNVRKRISGALKERYVPQSTHHHLNRTGMPPAPFSI